MSWSPTSNYWFGTPPRPARHLTTSATELVHLTVAFLVLTFDLAVVRFVLISPSNFGTVNGPEILTGVLFGLLAAATGFIAHEMAHKVAAQRYGFWAEFRLSVPGLLLSIVTALFGFLFAAPGATVVGGMGDAREWGRTSLAGPIVNLVASAGFVGVGALVAFLDHTTSFWPFFLLLSFINAWFATFNLLPFGPLDGRKVYRWSRGVWVVAIALSAVVAGGTFFLASTLPGPF